MRSTTTSAATVCSVLERRLNQTETVDDGDALKKSSSERQCGSYVIGNRVPFSSQRVQTFETNFPYTSTGANARFIFISYIYLERTNRFNVFINKQKNTFI